MGKVILDAELRAKLNGADAPLDVVDEAGKVVGRYLTEEAYRQIMFDMVPPMSDREREAVRQAIRDGTAATTADVQARLAAVKRAWEAGR